MHKPPNVVLPFVGKVLRNLSKILAVAASFWACGGPCEATTVYYQPTPYPLYKYDGTSMPQDLVIVHAWEGWINNSYYLGKPLFRQSTFQIGGWGDLYYSYLNFDLTGLPSRVNQAAVWLNAYSRGDSSTPVAFAFCNPIANWTLQLTWNSQPPTGPCYGWVSAPTAGSWSGFLIQSTNGQISWYNSWQNSSLFKGGLMLFPEYNNNNFDVFWNTLYNDYAHDPYADSRRPILQFDFTPPTGMPNFKMPLPGGYSWLLTNEIGGYECTGQPPWPDPAHQNANYFALDFTNVGKDKNGRTYPSSDVPILAAANGMVYDFGGSTTDSRGYYITLNHGNNYYTRYLHLKSMAANAKGVRFVLGQAVNQGDQLGIMGKTGFQTGINLHVNFWYGVGQGSSSISNLTYVVMDGLLLKSYQTECSINQSGIPTSWIRYYGSSNTPTGR